MTSSMPSSPATRSAVARLSLGCRSAVAGEHDRADAALAQRADGLGGAVARRVGDGDDRRRLAVDGDLHARAPLAGELVGAGSEAVADDVLALQQTGVTDRQPVSVDGGQQSVTGHSLEGLGARHLQAALPSGLADGLR